MAKISELNALTAPITSSDLVMIIRPGPGGIGYQSFKSPIKNFGNLTASIISASSVTANNFYGTASFVTTAETANSLTLANSYNITNLTGSNITASGFVSASTIRSATSVTSPSGNFTNLTASNISSSGFVSASNVVINGTLVNGSGSIAEGVASHAEGYIAQTVGIYSHAEGYYSVAWGTYSHAEGSSTEAEGTASHAEGYFTVASSLYSHAEGSGSWSGVATTSSGFPFPNAHSSHAEGLFTRTAGAGAHSEGNRTLASGIAAHAEGSLTTASGDYSHAEGIQTNATGQSSNAQGGATLSSGVGAHSEGLYATASANYSHAEGHMTEAAAQISHAEGSGSWAGYSIFLGVPGSSGLCSHAEGLFTRTAGLGSHSEGSGSIASGVASHAEGENTVTSGKASHAEGQSTAASADYQHVSGKFNLSSSNNNQLFIIGNGTSNSDRSNILMVSTSSLNIDGNINLTGSTAIVNPKINISGSGIFGGGRAVAEVNAALSSHYIDISTGGDLGENRVAIGTNNTLVSRGGVSLWNSSSASDLFSGSKYYYSCGIQSKTPYGGIMQYGVHYRSKYGSTTVGTANYYSYNTASQAIWVLKPTVEDQSNNGVSSLVNALDTNISTNLGDGGIMVRVVTGSFNNLTPASLTSLSIGLDNGSYPSGSGFTFSSIGSAGTNGGLRMISGSIYAPGSYGAKIGDLGIVSYTNQIRMGNDRDGGGYIAFASGSAGIPTMDGMTNVTTSTALVATNGSILISTGFDSFFQESSRIHIFGRTSFTGSINSTGYINLPRGVSSSLEVGGFNAYFVELKTGSMAFNTSSMNMVVFTGNGTTAFNNTMGWKIVTLS